jgi:hypothetical protein
MGMRDWIAVIMAVLGTLLVLAGGGLIVLRALSTDRTGEPEPVSADDATSEIPAVAPGRPALGVVAGGTPQRLVQAARRMPAADRLIGWGIVLLVLGAVAAGAISFNLGAEAGSR